MITPITELNPLQRQCLNDVLSRRMLGAHNIKTIGRKPLKNPANLTVKKAQKLAWAELGKSGIWATIGTYLAKEKYKALKNNVATPLFKLFERAIPPLKIKPTIVTFLKDTGGFSVLLAGTSFVHAWYHFNNFFVLKCGKKLLTILSLGKIKT